MESRSIDAAEDNDVAREVRILFVGSRRLGILANEIDTIADWRKPTPLPGAPKTVLGVVAIRGRMLTVLDVAELIGEIASATRTRLVSLRGDEQLALAVDRTGEVIRFGLDELKTSDETSRLILGEIADGSESISILNVNEIFPAAIRGHDRRHRRI
jgi:purine-binding chemotaxis protein CheW